MSPLMYSLLRHKAGETDDCALCSQREVLRKLGGGRRLRKVTGMDGDRRARHGIHKRKRLTFRTRERQIWTDEDRDQQKQR